MDTLKRKLTSRKLWVSLAGITTGIAIALGGSGNDISTISDAIVSVGTILSSALIIVGSVKSYVSGEASIDSANVSDKINEQINQIKDSIDKIHDAFEIVSIEDTCESNDLPIETEN